MKKKRILGFLLAINKPINIESLSKILHIDDYNPEIQIQELIEEGRLKGICKNSHYIP
jgi:chromosome segregation and condensation protein ScpB